LQEIASHGRAEFFALPAGSFDHPSRPFVHSPGLGNGASRERATPFEDEDD
jgi:hypothetical protein